MQKTNCKKISEEFRKIFTLGSFSRISQKLYYNCSELEKKLKFLRNFRIISTDFRTAMRKWNFYFLQFF